MATDDMRHSVVESFTSVPASPSRRRLLQATAAGVFSLPLAACNSSSDGDSLIDFSPTIADARAAIASAMAKTNTTSVSACLVSGNHVVWNEAFGVIDRVGNTPATTETLYNIGSVSKVFVTTAVMILVDRNQVDLDAPIITYIRDFRMLSPAFEKITVRMLLSHSSGFPGSYYENIFTFAPLPGYARAAQDSLADMHLKHEPGELAVYCNDGFTMAERLVEEVSGKTYAAFVRDEILAPLKMTRSRYPLHYYPEGAFAHPYLGDIKYGQEFVLAYGTGGLSSTPADMARFAMMFMNKGILDGRRILSEAAVKEMGTDQTTQLLMNPAQPWKWGLGWDSTQHPALHTLGFTCWEKNGGTAFFTSDFFVMPNEDLAVMITGTSGRYGAGALAERILLHALRDKRLIQALPSPVPSSPPPVAEGDASPHDLAGYYASNEGLIKVEQEGATLSVLIWVAGEWTVRETGLQLRDDGWFASDNSASAYRSSSIGSFRYLTRRFPVGYGHYFLTVPYGQRIQASSPLSPAWQARLGKSWLIISEHESSVRMVLDSPELKVEAVPEMPGYFVAAERQLNLPANDLRTRQFLKIPVLHSRDQNELVVYTHMNEEWLLFGGSRHRPLDTVPSVGPGAHAVELDDQGDAQWRRLVNVASAHIAGSRAWRLYDENLVSIQAGEGPGMIDPPTAGTYYLITFGEANSQATLTLA